jgi:uncharacterized protein DUF6883
VLKKLPQADRVVIDPQKVLGYLLSRSHPVGRFKARVFEAVEYGRKYTVVGELRGPAGAVRVLTVWMQEPGAANVRLVTVRPRWS